MRHCSKTPTLRRHCTEWEKQSENDDVTIRSIWNSSPLHVLNYNQCMRKRNDDFIPVIHRNVLIKRRNFFLLFASSFTCLSNLLSGNVLFELNSSSSFFLDTSTVQTFENCQYMHLI